MFAITRHNNSVCVGLYPHLSVASVASVPALALGLTDTRTDRSVAFRAAVGVLVAALGAFRPELVLLSIGFDGGMGLSKEDYYFATELLCHSKEYKFISLLEEGNEVIQGEFSGCIASYVSALRSL